MNDETVQDNNQGRFAIQKIYVKDISFEAPNSPDSFTEQWEPKVSLDLNSEGRNIGEDNFEVVLKITLTVSNGDKTAYLVEVQQAGIFHIAGFAEQDIGGMLGSFCPNILFPYARESISDLVTRGGFPPFYLAPINFDALYAQHLEQQQAQQKQAGEATSEN
jgi:preprotein translocase subunit SecB